MAAKLDLEQLTQVFRSRPDILEGIRHAADSDVRIQLFDDVASFIHGQTTSASSTTGSEPSLKRRRVDIEPTKNGSALEVPSAQDVAAESTLLEVKDISVSIPQRKKLDLCFTKQHIYARATGTTIPVTGAIFAWKNIEYAFYLPVPEKAQIQHNYIRFPRNSYFSTKNSPAPEDPLMFTIPAGAPKPGAIGGPNAAAAASVSDTFTTLLHWAINKCLQAAGHNVQIVAADPAKFHSMIKQPHRPKEQAVHVKAFRGSKDGYLFFLENGILWGFKKPLMFIPLDRIASVSYTSVLQRTFNMVVEIFTGEKVDGEEETEEIEFSMLDQEDYGGINGDYVARHGLQDRNMADQRKTKRELIENSKGKKGEEGANGANGEEAAGEDDGLTELERAQKEAEQQLQDDEDEDEEDYDPGSDGDSDGSGTSSEEEDDDDDANGEAAADDDEEDDDEEMGDGKE
ncbi:uncharacterized protein B0I36DRAFT_254895 [Microdochium trichocladiopsis]|uniref:Histone chaperone RTT106/FACT complex subunit SPT16-like middle domain-containing protein n=1 Tax=Microdochium trichocladiopsis TaxID=1682393 RepID=A0A9P8XTQ6_9PEZI|nr:uncharacterized protein B0I36DRAFT_254895 [Microdochium trichocladiopsis]KAH7016368.1 hypothetical protein B0I36DRAFT_254895 [Microdochium trichocladiopsis]